MPFQSKDSPWNWVRVNLGGECRKLVIRYGISQERLVAREHWPMETAAVRLGIPGNYNYNYTNYIPEPQVISPGPGLALTLSRRGLQKSIYVFTSGDGDGVRALFLHPSAAVIRYRCLFRPKE